MTLPGRTAAAAALTSLALGVPGTAWYVSGSREAAREAAALREAPRREARSEALRLAQGLAAQLEALRATESRRPFYHYQNLYHEPKGAYEGASVIPSPLASGPGHPLVKAFFQVGADGQLTLPTLNPELEAVNDQATLPSQKVLLSELEPLGQAFNRSARQTALPMQGQPEATQDKQQQGEFRGQTAEQVQVLDEGAWRQNLEANTVYRDIQQRKQPARPQGGNKGDVSIRVGPLRWCDASRDGAASLTALRVVGTPAGELTQGFAVSPEGVAGWLRGARLPARLLPGAPEAAGQAALPLEGVSWRVVVDASPALAAGEERAREALARFRRGFLGGGLAAGLAGLCVVGLVWQAERLARQRSRFAASAAHELRTPLAGLRMYGEMLAEGLGEPARSGEYARRIASEAERLGRVVANVLGFTRMERGTLAARSEAGDLGRAVREAASRLEAGLEANGARLLVEIPEGLPPARFDRDAVFQIVQNLLDNAEKYGRGGADRGIRLSLSSAPGGLLLAVEDRGPGVPRALRRRLFNPFVRGDGPEAPPGLGLGLAMTRALARSQGGEVACGEAPGGGARFTVSFSAAQDKERAP